MEVKEIRYETDVLVIGGGSAGLWAAYSVKKKNKDLRVMIAEKGAKNWGGAMACSGGDFQAVMPNENVDDWVKDFVYYYDGLCDQELIERLYKGSYERFQQYLAWGMEYLKKDGEHYSGIGQRSLDHVKLYVTKEKGVGGGQMAQVLQDQLEKDGVESLDRVMITDFLKDDAGRVVGAAGFHTIRGDLIVIKAKAVCLASNTVGFKASYMGNFITGEGLLAAFEAGAEIRNMEFARVWNVPVLFAWEGQTTLLPLGARFVNAKGEDFVAKYSPIIGGNTDVHYNVVAMALEAKKGNAPFYFDTTNLKEEDMAAIVPKAGWQGINYNRLKNDCGIDFMAGRTEWMPQLTGLYGGILADLDGATRVPGLYAAGRCRSIDCGVYSGGFDLSTTSGGGFIAGEAMVDYIADLGDTELIVDEEQLQVIKNRFYAPLDNGGLPYKEVLRVLQGIVFPGDVCILKSEESLTEALTKFEKVKKEVLPYIGASDVHYLTKVREVQAMAFAVEWYLKASLMRKESRYGHYRVDYPHREDDWLKWIVIGLENGRPEMHTERVPIEKYKHPIERYYQDNFTFSAVKQ